MDNNFTIIEDVFGDGGRNQITESRGYLQRTHVPEDMAPYQSRQKVGKVSERPDMPNVEDIRRSIGPSQNQNIQFQDQPQMFQPQINNDQMMMMYPTNDNLLCRDVFTHVQNCPVCSSYFNKDIKFYWLIIAILVIVILILTRNGK
jgi:hypothetical protein